jgi:hypothetical protein
LGIRDEDRGDAASLLGGTAAVWPLAAHPWFGIRACGKTLGWRLVSEHRLLLQSEWLEIFVLGSGVGGKLIAASPHRRPEVQHRWDFEAERSIDHTGPTALTRMPRCCASFKVCFSFSCCSRPHVFTGVT